MKRKSLKFIICLAAIINQPALAGNFGDWMDNTFNNGNRQAQEKEFIESMRRNRAVTEACEKAIASRIPNASTLQFGKSADGRSFLGNNEVSSTSGGWVTSIAGNTVDGDFDFRCYVDQSFRVTNIVRI